ncbi:MAG TPA: hypothetical protein VFI53_12780 [Myxococcaceae bacterium]|nr:hypothetical protein [Myxococcaceae bacterium]
MTGLLAILVLLSTDAGTTQQSPDAGVQAPPPASRSAEDEEIIANLDLLEHLGESQALEMILDLEAERAKANTDR